LPTLLLYDTAGLKLFEQITYLDEYYLTADEINVLTTHAHAIAARLPQGAMIVELGSGNLRKIKILLQALDDAKKDVTYYALDLMEAELVRTLAAVPHGTFAHVRCLGLLGTYDDGLHWLQQPEQRQRPKAVMSLGSSIGNFPRREAAEFLRGFAAALGPDDLFLVGVDACQDPPKVHRAYNDDAGVTHEFIRNGLRHANHLLGQEAFQLDEWKVIGEYDEAAGCHRAWVTPTRKVEIEGVIIAQHEQIRIEESYKYNAKQIAQLWAQSSLDEAAVWTNPKQSYALHLLTPRRNMFASKPEEYAADPVPSLTEWRSLWAVWDQVTRQMIPDEELLHKPIKLRNACIFYLGHIPTFFDIKLSEAAGLAPTEPREFRNIFERGIDPDVDNPEKCHAHSEIPDTWPELDVILKYQESVRQRVQDLYESGEAYRELWTGRALWLGFEHEVMHLETLLYMLVQSDKTNPPAGTARPDFARLAEEARKGAVPNQWFEIPAQTITIGIDDPDTGDGPLRHFGWDLEKPAQQVHVGAFRAQARPITNGEYARYLRDTGSLRWPASWVEQRDGTDVNGTTIDEENSDLHDYVRGKAVRTVYGLVPLQLALDWPVAASYDELNGCAKYMGGRIPTLEETRSIYEYALQNSRQPCQALQETIPAVNGHLVNNGVQESPPSAPQLNGDGAAPHRLDPRPLFADLTNANVGFKHWHPLPVVQHGNRLAGHAEMGGLWEWTSSPLRKREGFVPMKLYPAYSDDFYDEKHNVVLGGSWATHPRFAGRTSVINWYQRNYPYVWAGARLVQDL